MLSRFNSSVPWPLRLLIIVVIGLSITKGSVALLPSGIAITYKMLGKAPGCPWRRTLSYQIDSERWDRLDAALSKQLKVSAYEQALDIELISSPKRSYWIKRKGEKMDGKEL